MNTYRTEFFCHCPVNRVRIKYSLSVKTRSVIPVEEIITVVSEYEEDYHEEIADKLHKRFGGEQTLTADHHGVTIETVRGELT